MGTPSFTAIVTYHHAGTSRTVIDFVALGPAIVFGRKRAFDPKVAHVEILRGETVVWGASEGDSTT